MYWCSASSKYIFRNNISKKQVKKTALQVPFRIIFMQIKEPTSIYIKLYLIAL